ncbi:hypothetical protein KAI56_03935 [Candidatus Parcubacteria bacterium]|nr:hypothetical protein [Candidatus Parcubacteria bacterium]
MILINSFRERGEDKIKKVGTKVGSLDHLMTGKKGKIKISCCIFLGDENDKEFFIKRGFLQFIKDEIFLFVKSGQSKGTYGSNTLVAEVEVLK